MSTPKIFLHKPEEKGGGTSGPGTPPPELAVIQQEELLRPLLEQMQKINEALIKVESALLCRQKQISETSRKANLMLTLLGEKEEEKEDLSFILTNDLAPLTGSEASEIKEEVDMALKAYSTYIKENTLPEEGDVELSRKYIRDLISSVIMEPVKVDGRKYKKKKKREKMEFIFKTIKPLKRHASRMEAALKTGMNASSEEDNDPGGRGDGAGVIKMKGTQLLVEKT